MRKGTKNIIEAVKVLDESITKADKTHKALIQAKKAHIQSIDQYYEAIVQLLKSYKEAE